MSYCMSYFGCIQNYKTHKHIDFIGQLWSGADEGNRTLVTGIVVYSDVKSLISLDF